MTLANAHALDAGYMHSSYRTWASEPDDYSVPRRPSIPHASSPFPEYDELPLLKLAEEKEFRRRDRELHRTPKLVVRRSSAADQIRPAMYGFATVACFFIFAASYLREYYEVAAPAAFMTLGLCLLTAAMIYSKSKLSTSAK